MAAVPRATNPLFAWQTSPFQPSPLFWQFLLHPISGMEYNYSHVAGHKFHHSKDKIILSYHNNNGHYRLKKYIHKKLIKNIKKNIYIN